MKALLLGVAVVLPLVGTASAQVPLPPPPLPPGAPIVALCPAAASPARTVGRILGVPVPAPRAVIPPPAAWTPEFAGTQVASLASGITSFTNTWASPRVTRFHNVIEGPVGPVRLTLETCSTATGGETVAIYPATAAGQRVPRRPRVMFSIAVPRGNMRQAVAYITPSRPGSPTGSLSLVVVIENASGRFNHGAYRLTAAR